MTTSIDPESLANEVAGLREEIATFDSAASTAPSSIDAGAATSLVAGWIVFLCGSGADALSATDALCGATEAAATELVTTNSEVATTLAFMEASA